MHDGQSLTYAELLAEAKAAVKASGTKQMDLAAQLGVSQGAISHALSREGSRYAALQVRIVEALTPFDLNEAPVQFIARRRA